MSACLRCACSMSLLLAADAATAAAPFQLPLCWDILLSALLHHSRLVAEEHWLCDNAVRLPADFKLWRRTLRGCGWRRRGTSPAHAA